VARASEPAGNTLVFDPVSGLLGLEFAHRNGPLADSELRRALSMALDRAAIVRALAVPGLQARETLVSPGVSELPQPAFPAWAIDPPALRRVNAARAVTAAGGPLTLRVAMPDGPGYRLLFAYLKRDWGAIGVTAERVRPGQQADLRLVDAVAPINLATWYLRHFTCDAAAVCDSEADQMLAAARIAPDAAARREQLAAADRLLTDITAFVPIAAPVRWSLVSPRLNGFRPNAFGRHPAGELVRPAP
jgi:peptide/nickel transport system substrate-binding protein